MSRRNFVQTSHKAHKNVRQAAKFRFDRRIERDFARRNLPEVIANRVEGSERFVERGLVDYRAGAYVEQARGVAAFDVNFFGVAENLQRIARGGGLHRFRLVGEAVNVNDPLTLDFFDGGAMLGAFDDGSATDGRNANKSDRTIEYGCCSALFLPCCSQSTACAAP